MAFKLDFLGAKINELLHKIDNLNPDDFGKIDTIKVNGTPQTITEKAVDITVPTTASDVGALPNTIVIPTNNNQLTNGAGYITSAGSCSSATYALYSAADGSTDVCLRNTALYPTDTTPPVNGRIYWTYK